MPTAADLAQLRDWLRTNEFEVTSAQLASARLLLEARNLALIAAEAQEVARVLRPVFAKNALQQQRFPSLITWWLESRSSGSTPEPPARPDEQLLSGKGKLLIRVPWELVALCLVLSVCFVGARVSKTETLEFLATRGTEAEGVPSVRIVSGDCSVETDTRGVASCQLPWYRLAAHARANAGGQERIQEVDRIGRLWRDPETIEFRFDKVPDPPPPGFTDANRAKLDVIEIAEVPTPVLSLVVAKPPSDVTAARAWAWLLTFCLLLLPFLLLIWFALRVSKGLAEVTDRIDVLTGAVADMKLKVVREMRRIAGAMRNQVNFQSFRLNLRATSNATVRAGGLFKPVFTAKRERHFIFLVERQSIQDHHARVGLDLAEQCRSMGVDVQIFTFTGDLAVLRPVPSPRDRKRRPVQRYVTTAELLGGNSASEVVLVCDPRALVETFRANLSPWAQRICNETAGCAVLTMVPAGLALRAQTILAAAHIPVLPVRQTSLQLLADAAGWWTKGGNLRPAGRPQLEPAFEYVGSGLSETDIAPSAAEISKLTEALSAYLGTDGLRWLQACALYPRVDWAVTVALGRLLADEHDRETTLLRMSGLVWFRTARFPEWLSLALAAQLSGRDLRSLRRFFWSLFRLSTDDGTFRLNVWWSRFKALMAAERSPVLRERVYARFLLGQRPTRLDLPASTHLWRSLLNSTSATAAKATVVFAVAAGAVSFWLNPQQPGTRVSLAPKSWDVAVGTEPARIVLAWSSGAEVRTASRLLLPTAEWQPASTIRFDQPVEVIQLASTATLLAKTDKGGSDTVLDVGVPLPELSPRIAPALELRRLQNRLVAFSPGGSAIAQISQSNDVTTAALTATGDRYRSFAFPTDFIGRATMAGVSNDASSVVVASPTEIRGAFIGQERLTREIKLGPLRTRVPAVSREAQVTSAFPTLQNDVRRALAMHHRGRGFSECYESGQVVNTLVNVLPITSTSRNLTSQTRTIKAGSCTALAVHPASGFQAIGQPDGTVRLVDPSTPDVLYPLQGRNWTQSPVRKLAFSTNGEYLAVAREDRSISLVRFRVTVAKATCGEPPHFDEEECSSAATSPAPAPVAPSPALAKAAAPSASALTASASQRPSDQQGPGTTVDLLSLDRPTLLDWSQRQAKEIVTNGYRLEINARSIDSDISIRSFDSTAAPGRPGSPGASGVNGDMQQAGSSGQAGEPGGKGETGRSASEIIVRVSGQIAGSVRIANDGQIGGDGGPGGQGGPGGAGGRGAPARQGLLDCRSGPGFGGAGGDGGVGGPGGPGGDGGKAGQVEVVASSRSQGAKIEVSASGGAPGKPGAGGKGGIAGRGGPEGALRDLCRPAGRAGQSGRTGPNGTSGAKGSAGASATVSASIGDQNLRALQILKLP